MKNIKFIKDPGYTYDLFFLFVLNFNIDYCLTNFINYNKSSEDTDYFNNILANFDAIPNDLLPFFYIKENGRCFITQYYYEAYRERFTTDYNLTAIQADIANYDQVITNLLKFYFIDIDEHILTECKTSVKAVGKLIKNSKYNDTLKSSLYAFFMDPIPVIQKLSYELMSKEFQLSKQYEKSYPKITELQHKIDIQLISDKLKMCNEQSCDIDSFNDTYITICLNHKNIILLQYYEDNVILQLGIDYLSCLEYLVTRTCLPELESFGNALAEKNRIEILDLMLRKGEITIKDTEQELGFTGTNAYYHISLMIKANMIKTRNQGRTVLYSINKQYFDGICDTIKKYSSETERR